jgi:hypothetical protein
MSVLHSDIDLLSVTLGFAHASRRSAGGEARGVDKAELKRYLLLKLLGVY